MTDAEWDALAARLKPYLTHQFLATLAEACRVVGNGTDSVANADFVSEVFNIAGQPVPDLQPYDSQ